MDYNRYFISLEDRFLDIARYIDINEKNIKTFSSEIAINYMAASSEFEVVLKELCKLICPDKNYRWAKMSSMLDIVTSEYPSFISETVFLSRYKIEVTPFATWFTKDIPIWWKSNGELKHNRSVYYEEANLENLIDSISALQIVNHYLVWKSLCPRQSRNAPALHMDQHPKLFRLKNVNYDGPYSSADVFDIID